MKTTKEQRETWRGVIADDVQFKTPNGVISKLLDHLDTLTHENEELKRRQADALTYITQIQAALNRANAPTIDEDGDPVICAESRIRVMGERLAETQEALRKLKSVLINVLASAYPNAKEHPTMTAAWADARAALGEGGES